GGLSVPVLGAGHGSLWTEIGGGIGIGGGLGWATAGRPYECWVLLIDLDEGQARDDDGFAAEFAVGVFAAAAGRAGKGGGGRAGVAEVEIDQLAAGDLVDAGVAAEELAGGGSL